MEQLELSHAIFDSFRQSVAVRAGAVAKKGAFYSETPGLTRYGFNVRFPLFNGALGVRLSRTEARAHLARDQKFFGDKKLPFCWWVDSEAEPVGLGKLLEEAGMHSPGPYVTLVSELGDFSDRPFIRSDVEVREVHEPESFGLFMDLLQGVFGFGDEVCDEYGEVLRSRCGPGRPWHHYLAYLNGAPVGAVSLFYSGGIALMAHGAVLPPYRCQGVATATVDRAMRDASALGATHCGALLMASQQARPLLNRFGFVECGEITPYVFGADANRLEASVG